MSTKTALGIVGCGNISSTYLQAPLLFENLYVAACADIDLKRAHSQAKKYDVPKVCSVEELLADPEIDIVVNLTISRRARGGFAGRARRRQSAV